MKLPLFVFDETPCVEVYNLVDDAIHSMELPDVEAGLYSIYDSDAKQLVVRVVPQIENGNLKTRHPIWASLLKFILGLADYKTHRIEIVDDAGSIPEPDELKKRLLHHITDCQKTVAVNAETSIEELMKIVTTNQ